MSLASINPGSPGYSICVSAIPWLFDGQHWWVIHSKGVRPYIWSCEKSDHWQSSGFVTAPTGNSTVHTNSNTPTPSLPYPFPSVICRMSTRRFASLAVDLFGRREDDETPKAPHHGSPVVAFIIGLSIILLASILNAAGLNLTKLDHVSFRTRVFRWCFILRN